MWLEANTPECYFEEHSANVHRGAYALAERATEALYVSVSQISSDLSTPRRSGESISLPTRFFRPSSTPGAPWPL